MAGVRCLGPPNAQRKTLSAVWTCGAFEHRVSRSRLSHPYHGAWCDLHLLPMRYAYVNDACERERQTELQLDGRLMERVGLWLCASSVSRHRVRCHSTSVLPSTT